MLHVFSPTERIRLTLLGMVLSLVLGQFHTGEPPKAESSTLQLHAAADVSVEIGAVEARTLRHEVQVSQQSPDEMLPVAKPALCSRRFDKHQAVCHQCDQRPRIQRVERVLLLI